MRTVLLKSVLILSMASSTVGAQGVQLGTLRIVIEGIATSQGQVKVGLEKTADAFDQGPLHEARYRGETVPSREGRLEILFRDVPYGTYAIKSFHDADGNGVLNTNFMGIPTEDYGFSNNARGTMGPAKFRDARFDLDRPEKTLIIQLK